MRVVTWLAVVVFFCAAQVRADSVLTYDVSSDGTVILNGSTLTDSSFVLQTTFSIDQPIDQIPGESEYLATSITAQVGGTSFVADLSADIYAVVLADGANPNVPGEYAAALVSVQSGAFAPFYTSVTTANWNATTPTSTGFSGYDPAASLGSNFITLFDSSSNELDLSFDTGIGPDTTLTAVPLPSAQNMFTTVCIVMGFGALVRRRLI
jgi:hypothetical protein